MIKAKAKGTRREHKTKKLLEACGYTVTRAAGSMGAFDLIAFNRLGTRCIQVKSNVWPGPIERETMRNVGKQLAPNSTVECWRWNDGDCVPRIKYLDEF